MSDAFVERAIDVEGKTIRCFEGGSGAAVLSLHAAPTVAPTAFEALLAEKFRVLVLASPGFAAHLPQDAARLIARAIPKLGLGPCGLMASGTAAPAALFHAADATDGAAPEALVLLSPASTVAAAEGRMSTIQAPTLILVGTRDERATESAGRLCAERIPESYPMLVYDAGPDMAAERPAALFEVVADFLERRGRFVLERQESLISP